MQHKTPAQTPQSTRRRFLQSTGAVAAGLSLSRADAAPLPTDTLALFGNAKTITVPSDVHRDAFQWPRFAQEEEEAVLEVMRRPSYRPIDELESDCREYFNAPHVKAHCSGTTALTSMFFALDLPPGSEIMVPSYTFFATIIPMRLFGLVPVFVDIDPRTLNMDVQDLERRVTARTRAIVPVHWFGLPCDMDQIFDFASEHDLIVVPDSAQAAGATFQRKPITNLGRMSIVSFQTSKQVCALEGGIGIYQEREDYERATTFGHYGVPSKFPEESSYRKYYGTGLGPKLRMHPLAAALARVQLRGLDERNAIAHAQTRRLNDRICQLPGLYEPRSRPDAERGYYSINALFIDEKEAGMSRATVVKALKAEGVRASEYVYRLQHKCTIYSEAKWWHHPPVIPELPGSEQANRETIRLPLFTAEAPEVVDQYATAFEKVWAHRRQLS
jgi:perosamine synthetase